MSTHHPRQSFRHAFSLVELLVVIAIIAIIGAFAVPAAGQLLKGSSITQAANILTDQAATARQQALTRNRSIEFRLYSFADPEDVGSPPPTYFRAVQFFEIADGGVPNPTGKFVRFPNSIVMNPTAQYSSLLQAGTSGGYPKLVQTPLPNDPDLPRGIGKQYTYVAFRFQPDGTTSLPPTGGTSNGLWFLTVQPLSELNAIAHGTLSGPTNFFTWMIDPIGGSTKIIRPGTGTQTAANP